MPNPDELIAILDRILNGSRDESEIAQLRQWLKVSGSTLQFVSQDGKLNTNIGQVQGGEIHIGDRIYQGADAETIKTVIQAVLQHPPVQQSQLTPQEYRNRQALLNKVKNFWVLGVLEASLHHQVIIQLGLEDRSNVLATPWNLVVETADRTQTVLSQDTTVLNLFDRLGTGRTLLILGEPGAGKTITLLQLARELLARAEQDMNHLIPVVFNLSTWSSKWHNLADWLVAELNTKYQVPKAIALPWVNQQQLLLLLDGLDEARAQYRDACVVALNQFQQAHGTEMVLCSRIKDYEGLSHRLTLQQAIYLRSLTPEQVNGYLNSLNTDLTGLRELLAKDSVLQELARSPLMLNIMVLADEGISPKDFPQISAEAQRQRLFNTYIDRMLRRRGLAVRYSPAQTIRWLSWLAQQLVSSSQSIFLIEWLDRKWLQSSGQRWLYLILSSLIVGLALGLMIVALTVGFKQDWLTVGLMFWVSYSLVNLLMSWSLISVERMQPSPRQILLQRLVNSLWTGLESGLVFGTIVGVMKTLQVGWTMALLTGLVIGLMDWSMGGVVEASYLKPVEALRWSWKNIRKYLMFGLIGSTPIGLLLGLTGVLGHNLIEGMLLGILGGLIFGLFSGLRSGVEVETRTSPNHGIWQSARTSATVTAILSLGLSLGIYIVSPWLTLSLNWGLFWGLYVGLLMGGVACIVHISLRIVFYFHRYIPWNYARFLDYAVERIFLQKVGGGYIFIHRLLMEHFAAMSVEKWK